MTQIPLARYEPTSEGLSRWRKNFTTQPSQPTIFDFVAVAADADAAHAKVDATKKQLVLAEVAAKSADIAVGSRYISYESMRAVAFRDHYILGLASLAPDVTFGPVSGYVEECLEQFGESAEEST